MIAFNSFDATLEKWNLLKHPFYQAWAAGTLPPEALQTYAREYGNFIRTLPQGWETAGDPQTADEEREHAELWDDFTRALGAEPAPAAIDQTRRLEAAARSLFAEPASALGALYAFEARQPATAESKLDGLRRHYHLPEPAYLYFDLHTTNAHEAEKIRRLIAALPQSRREQAAVACETMAAALWDALCGIHGAHSEA